MTCLYYFPPVLDGHSERNQTTQTKLRILFQAKFNPFISPEINIGSIFGQVFFTLSGVFFYRFYSISILWNLQLSGQPDLSGQSAIPR